MSTSIVLTIIVAEAYSVASADGCDLMGVRLWLLGNDRRGTRFLVFAAAVGLFHNHASAGTLVHLRSVVWGCVDPNVATSINNSSNPNLSDPQWVAHATQVGQCVTIGTESSWETLSPDFNGLTYVAYRGTVGKPGSFWVPTAAIDFNVPQPVSLPPVTTTNLPAPEPPAPPTPSSLPTPLTSPEPTAAPEASGIAAQTVSAESQPSPTTPTPISPAPEPPDSASTTATTTGDQNGSLGGILGVLALLAIAALIRRSRRLKVKAKRRVPQVETSKPKPTTSVREHPASPAQTPALSGSARPPLSRATNEVQPPKQPGSGSARHETRLGTTIPNEPAVTWYGPGDRVTVLGATVADGMVYIGAASGAGGQHDASFINPSLPIASSSVSAGPLGYWPSYGSVTPECRRRYLEWLASGKRDPDADIGYVFLYFYGLERRLLIEAPAREEVRALVAEIQRLRTIYDGNRSFAGYSSRLLDAMLLLHDLPSAESRFVPDLSAPLGDMAPALKVAIAREVVADRPLSFELSAAALCGLSEFSSQHRQVLDKGRPAFLAVLESRFRTTFPSGFPLRNRKDSRLQLVYRGASAGLEVNIAARVGLTTLPDPATLTWTKLLALAGAVAEEVAPYVKALAYHPARANSLAALIGCPAELRNTVALEARQWLESLPSPTAVRFGVLAKNAIGAGSVKWTVRHQRQVGEVLSALGYAMEPDPLEGVERLEDETQVQVFRCAGSARSRAMDVAGAAAMLVAAVAKTAPDAAETSTEFWLSRLPSRLSLTVDETTRLRARLAWLSTKTATLAKATRLLGDATAEEKALCAWSATVAAGATGMVGKPQLAMLEAIHDALAVPRASLYAGLHAGIGAAADAAHEPILVSEAVRETLHPIPRPPTEEPATVMPDRLARIRAETESVQAMLADIFVDDEVLSEVPEPAGEGPFAGLDAEHSVLLARLLSRQEWSREEFEHAASAAGLMPGGAMETINEWAFDHHGDALLDDGDPIVVNRALLETDADAIVAE